MSDNTVEQFGRVVDAMSHPLLAQLDDILDLMERVNQISWDEQSRADLTRYLRWAARRVAKSYWYSIEQHSGD